MTVYDPNQPSPAPYTPPPGYTTVPTAAQPMGGADRWGLIAITITVMTLLSCVPGLNCLVPLAPLVAGIITLTQAKNAVDPGRARTYGWIATGLGILAVLAIIGIIIVYGAFVASIINEVQNNPEFRTAP